MTVLLREDRVPSVMDKFARVAQHLTTEKGYRKKKKRISLLQ